METQKGYNIMAYNYYNQQRQGGYNNNRRYQQQKTLQEEELLPIKTLEEFLSQRLDVYLSAIDLIKARGLDPADFAFALGGWVSCYIIEKEKNEFLNGLKEAKTQFFKRNYI